jgi:hypothetical protein
MHRQLWIKILGSILLVLIVLSIFFPGKTELTMSWIGIKLGIKREHVASTSEGGKEGNINGKVAVRENHGVINYNDSSSQ